ncbi:hypothetical protein JL720_6058 [Aureococcus anophagefferens]|nr:hypothetical protein JL720_6058 [Aureococcus anophagefferens]
MPNSPPDSPRGDALAPRRQPWHPHALSAPVDRHGFPAHLAAPLSPRDKPKRSKERTDGVAPPAAYAAWGADDVAAVVSELCRELGVGDCGGLFRGHEVTGDVLAVLGANDLALLCEGHHGADDGAALATLRKVGPRFRLHAAIRRFLETHRGREDFAAVREARPSLKHAARTVLDAVQAADGLKRQPTARKAGAAFSSPRAGATWTVKEAGLVVAHILRETENGDEEMAVKIAEVLEGHHIDGKALAHVTREELREMGDKGTSFGELRLQSMGVRLRLTEGLHAFLREHGERTFDEVTRLIPELMRETRKLRESMSVQVDRDTDKIDALLHAMSGKDFDYRLLHKSLDTRPHASVRHLDEHKPKKVQIVVPVYMTILVKKLSANRGKDEEDSVNLVGTLIQRPLLYDLAALQRAKSTTFATKMPMKLYSVFSAHPFHIMAAEVLVELTSFTGKLPEKNFSGAATTTYELRPSLMCHCRDLRNLVSVRDFDDLTKLDEMKKWEVMNTSPTVEYQADGDGIPGKKPFYTPKVKITFYLYRDATQPFLETIMPLLFAIFTNTLNIIWASDFNEFLGNELAIGLTLVFLIPSLSENESFNDTFQINHVYVMWIFFSLMVSSTVFPKYYKIFAIVVSWLSLVLPFSNLSIYLKLKRRLLLSPHYDAENAMTFKGRPGKAAGNSMGSDVPFLDLCQFFDPDSAPPPGDKKAKAKLKLNEATIHDDCVKDLQAYAPNGPRPWKLEGNVFDFAKKRKDKKEGKAERKGDARGGRDASIAPNAAPPG